MKPSAAVALLQNCVSIDAYVAGNMHAWLVRMKAHSEDISFGISAMESLQSTASAQGIQNGMLAPWQIAASDDFLWLWAQP